MGRAQLQAGRPEAARLAFESGLELAAARVTAQPGSYPRHAMHAELLAWLGRTDEALAGRRRVCWLELDSGLEQRLLLDHQPLRADLCRAGPGPQTRCPCPAPAAGPVGQGLATAGRSPRRCSASIPCGTRIRDDPQVQQVLTEAEAAEIAALPPRDWPKNLDLKRAVALLDGLQAIPEDFRLAEEIVQPVMEKFPTDPETLRLPWRCVQSHPWLLSARLGSQHRPLSESQEHLRTRAPARTRRTRGAAGDGDLSLRPRGREPAGHGLA